MKVFKGVWNALRIMGSIAFLVYMFLFSGGAEALPLAPTTKSQSDKDSPWFTPAFKLHFGAPGFTVTDSIDITWGEYSSGYQTIAMAIETSLEAATGDSINITYRPLRKLDKNITYKNSTLTLVGTETNLYPSNNTVYPLGDGVAISSGGSGSSLANLPLTVATVARDSCYWSATVDSLYPFERNAMWFNTLVVPAGCTGARIYLQANDTVMFIFPSFGK